MPSPGDSTQAGPLAEGRRLQVLIGAAAAQLQAAGLSLVGQLAGAVPGPPVSVDGQLAEVEGEPLDVVRYLVEKATGICEVELAEVIALLSRLAEDDPVEAIVEEVREWRFQVQRAAERARRIPRDEPGDGGASDED